MTEWRIWFQAASCEEVTTDFPFRRRRLSAVDSLSKAGIGTIFVIIAIGVGGGLMLAKTALKEPAGYQAPANTESTTSARVILPTSAEAAQPSPPDAATVPKPDPQTPAQPSVKQVQAPAVEKVDTRKAQAQERDRRRRYAERKAKKMAAARAWQQHEQWTRGAL
jgi:type IV secretory pathway VirB10-like protein